MTNFDQSGFTYSQSWIGTVNRIASGLPLLVSHVTMQHFFILFPASAWYLSLCGFLAIQDTSVSFSCSRCNGSLEIKKRLYLKNQLSNHQTRLKEKTLHLFLIFFTGGFLGGSGLGGFVFFSSGKMPDLMPLV